MKSKMFFGAYLVLLLFTICAVVIGCDKFKESSTSGDGPDSVYVAEAIQAAENPSFTTVTEVCMFQNKLLEDQTIEEAFMTMPENILVNVATVCLKKDGVVTKKDIITEYNANRSVYDNLPDKPTETAAPDSTPKQPTAKEESKPEGKVSYKYELDTAGGKRIVTLEKEEK